MNKQSLRFTFFLFIFVTLPLATTAQVIDIPDSNLRAAIEKALGVAAGEPITVDNIATLTRLEAQNANISDLTGLEHATNLTTLNLGHVLVGTERRPINSNSLSNISLLGGLTNLTELWLGFNSIENISPLAGLTNLTWLDLTGNLVSNIAPIANLTKLTHLDLDGNAISDISAVAGLTNLTFLDIWSTPISDISPVADLTNLTTLGLGYNNISDISPVVGLTNLTGLYLLGNHITDISYLSDLTNLKTLWLQNNWISDLSSLVTNTGLGSGDTVNVRQNRLSDQSLYTYIPALQSRGVTVEFDDHAPFRSVPFDVTNIPEPVPPPPVVRDFFQLDPYYQQWINVRGFPVLTSAEVSPYAVKEAAWTIGHMIGHRPDVLRVMAERTVRFSIVPHNKHTSDMPESNTGRLSFFWDVRHRAVHCKGCPIASTTEEALISKSASPIHEFGHLLQDWGLNGVDPTFNNGVTTLYDMAKAEGLYQGYYAGSTESEYWAEGVTSWFHDTNQKQHVALTRSALKKYDPRLAKLLTEVFGDGDWRYTRPATRTHLPHLQGFNPQEAPIYQRPPELLELEKQLLDPNSDGGGKWVNLKLFNPSALSHLKRLTTGRNRTDFIFGNLTGTDLTLYTVNDDGKKTVRYYSTTDDFMALDTYVGAIWLIQDHTGKGIAVFRAEEEVGRVLITPTTVFITSGLSKVSGDNQTDVSSAVLVYPLVVEVRDEKLTGLEGVSVTFTVTAGDGTLSVTHTTTDENGRAESILTLGPNLGINTVKVSATGIESTATFYAVSDTESPSMTADVNSDGSVNVLDLVVIASELGNAGTNLAVDVNGDGDVNVLDLILAAGMFDGAAAAPSAQPQVPEILTAVEVQGWLTDARSLEVRDLIMKRGFVVLEQLLVALTPKETELLHNYPNPFNPETWIPYRLAEDAFVTLTIYDLSGQVVRNLDVGHRIASAYENQSKAIYWNGRNNVGERVASGVYFYALTAGDFSATRKMLILK